MIRPIFLLAGLASIFIFSGWRTVADAEAEEKVRQQLKWMDRDAFALELRVNDLEQRIKALEAKP